MDRKYVSGISDRLASKIFGEDLNTNWVVLKIQPAIRVFGIDPKWKSDKRFMYRVRDKWDFSLVCDFRTVNTGQMLNIWS